MEELKRKRGTIKATLTRFSNYLEAGGKTDDATVIEAWIANKESLMDKYDEIQSQIEQIVTDDTTDKYDIHEEEADRERFEINYFSIMGKARSLVKKHRGENSESNVNTNSNHGGNNSLPNPPSHAIGVNLPKINLANFDGDYGNWIKFRDMFRTSIHDNKMLSNVNKFNYLNSVLKGEAASVIAEVSVSEEDYEEAWKTLCARYDDKRALILHHVEGLHNTPALTHDSPKDLRKLIDSTKNHLKALKKLGQSIEHWDVLIIYILTAKLNVAIKREWERERMHLKDDPTLKNMIDFLEEYCKFLKNTTSNVQEEKVPKTANNKSSKSPRNEQTKSFSVTTRTCPLCTETHGLYACPQFKELSVAERVKKVAELKVCFNCLGGGHQNRNCKFGPCRVCNKKHNRLLHLDAPHVQASMAIKETSNVPAQGDPPQPQNVYLASRSSAHDADYVLLGTANVYLLDRNGKRRHCRALLDGGSQAHIITKDCCRRLNLNYEQTGTTLRGIEQMGKVIRHKSTVKMESLATNYSRTITCLIMDSISDNLPSALVQSAGIEIPRGIELADPNYDKSRPVDLLIGAGLFYELLCVGQIKLKDNHPILQKTLLGWIVAGNIKFPQKIPSVRCNLIKNDELHEQLERFWKIENCFSEAESSLQLKNDYCEQHFINTTKRDQDGRFIVSIPLKEEVALLGSSKEMALKRFFHNERKLAKNDELRAQYVEFMREYENLGHMTEVTSEQLETANNEPHFYLPHHAVLKEASTTTKLRVVFDGSAKTSSGLSLNDVEYVGPVVQEDLFCIVVRARMHRYALSADVAKMYRQVKIKKKQRRLQRIIWRETPSLPIRHLELNTVTYGTSSAAYLATRSLQEVGNKNKVNYPHTSLVICRDFYVDDLFTGAETKKEAVALKNELTALLGGAGMELRKWASNEPSIISNDKAHNSVKEIPLQGDRDPKTLGLLWDPTKDILKYSVNNSGNEKITKRTILSIIAQIFDPLGLVGPAVIQAKLILQKLWALNVSWDESLPQDVHELWAQIHSQLMQINKISAPRRVRLDDYIKTEIHGFCDASERAYGACIYVCTQNQGGRRAVQLLCAKSRVAPLKALTLPRLELLGAVLLAQLANKIMKACDLPIDTWHFWTDSTVVLAWLRAPPLKWKTFVASRTAEIQELTNSNWRHVQSEFNPADLISRGMNASELIDSNLWWHGPSWLTQDQKFWPSLQQIDTDLAPEQRKILHTFIAQEINDINKFKIKIDKEFNKTLFERFSSYTHMIRTTAFILKFITKCKARVKARKDGLAQVEKEPSAERFITLRTDELRLAAQHITILAQGEMFPEDIAILEKGTSICKGSQLKQLNPFLDKEGILRVGGRLDNAAISYEQKHPILLAPHHKLTRLLINYEHRRLLHAGCQAVLLSLRTKYWLLTGKRAVKNIISKCISCFRANPTELKAMMGNLPASRVNPTRPFYNCGVDYAGPFLLKEKTRSRTSIKAYVCIFVCFVTKATHIELAVDLSAEAFLNCLKRFISRRGRCANIYSDNGTNFVGASNELKELKDLLKNINFKQEIVEFANCENINWHFIPPRAPHFGGLWEGAVKSAKYHLKRVIGETRLTYEEFCTILTQVEACLNSRPLYPLSDDPNDLTPLTPSHFLIGDLLTALPEGDLRDIKESRLNRYQHLQQMLQHFWQRWQREYLPQMQKRQKWTKNTHNQVKLDAMVLIKEENTPPMQWPLGRITELHPGKDGITRVVSIRTSKGIIKRPLVKICPLPVEDMANNE